MSEPTFGIVDVARRTYGSLLDLKNLFHQTALPVVVLFGIEELSARLTGDEGSLAIVILSLVVWLIVAMTVMLGWSRYVLLGETPPSLPMPRLGRRELLFVAYSIAFAILVYGPSTLAVAIGSAFEDLFGLYIAVLLIGLAIALAVGPRLSLAFPLIALDRPRPIATAWTASRGHTLKLVGLWVLVSFPMVVVLSLLGFVVPDPDAIDTQAQQFIASLVYTISGVIWLCISAAAASYAARGLLPDV